MDGKKFLQPRAKVDKRDKRGHLLLIKGEQYMLRVLPNDDIVVDYHTGETQLVGQMTVTGPEPTYIYSQLFETSTH